MSEIRVAVAPIPTEWARGRFVLPTMIGLGILLRLLFITADGFKNDVVTFESWALTLSEHPMREFYAKAGFADYPPGYFFILWFIGHVYKFLIHSDASYTSLKVLVKLPAIVMDSVDAIIVFALVRRIGTALWQAYAAAALFLFNPATIFISAYWGQVDSVAAAFAVGALLLVMYSDALSGRAAVAALIGAWLAIAYSILIKPQASILVFLLLAYAFATRDRTALRSRLTGTAAGIAAAFLLAYAASYIFHPGLNPIDQFSWLRDRYAFGSNVYAYNSVNAFTLYTIAHPFWQADNVVYPIPSFGLPQFVWGILLLAAATISLLVAYVQRPTRVRFLESACLLSLAFFVLSTRMHERYVFNAFLLTIPLAFLRRRYLVAAIILSLTLFANLSYSLEYLHVMDAKITGINEADLWPGASRVLSFMNVAVFFVLGYAFLGSNDLAFEAQIGRTLHAIRSGARAWFSPLEGLARMEQIDYMLAGTLTCASFVVCSIGAKWPTEKVFDEVYYARAAEEYIAHKDIFEFTHPPLTKLWITVTTLLVGDTSYGWRLASLIAGALTVGLIYIFAKRLLRSTPFALLAAGMLTFDGFHFVQSRIATPEVTVAFFSLLVLYAFYRFWLASQVRDAASFVDAVPRRFAVGLLAAILLAASLMFVVCDVVLHGQSQAAHVVTFVYFFCGGYVGARWFASWNQPRDISYADGTRIRARWLWTPDGGQVPIGSGKPQAGTATVVDGNSLVCAQDETTSRYATDGSLTYSSPAGTAVYAADGSITADGVRVDAGDARTWLWVLAVSGGLLAASKWNGLFDLFVVWGIAAAVAFQAEWPSLLRAVGIPAKKRAATWGNPFGISIDVMVAVMLFVGATMYVLSYIPYFTLGKTLTDMVELQHGMYAYHAGLVATHPYSSRWWQWPILQIPISYYYHDFRVGADASNPAACCISEIMALPNPIVWWAGLITVPAIAWLAWRDRNKGLALLSVAYVVQWLPWIASPRLSFLYHFYPNLAIIVLANAAILQRIWKRSEGMSGRFSWPRIAVGSYVLAVLIGFAFWYPVFAGTHITYDAWNARMLPSLMGSNWINPHPGQ